MGHLWIAFLGGILGWTIRLMYSNYKDRQEAMRRMDKAQRDNMSRRICICEDAIRDIKSRLGEEEHNEGGVTACNVTVDSRGSR